MDVKLTVTKTLDDNYWGFDDMLDGLDLTAPEEIKAEIIAYIRDADPWTAIDPDDGAIWTVSIDGDAPDWQARAEAAETDLRELRENTLLALGLNPVNVADGTEDVTIAYLLSGLRERVQELEAQLAAMDDDEREDVRHRAIINDVFGDDAKWGCDE